MKTKILALSLISFALWASQGQTEQEKAEEKRRMQALEELGLPLPGSGIKIVPRATFGMSAEQLARGQKAEEERKRLGYSLTDNCRAEELLHFKTTVKADMKAYSGSQSDLSTHLRKNIKDLKLGFPFKGVPAGHLVGANQNIRVLAVTPQGAFKQDLNGWSGAVQYFEAKHIGVCTYAIMNVKASETAVEIALEDVTYDVNKKPTLSKVEGKPKAGFIYKIEWYDDVNFHELECANRKYSVNIANDVMSLAKQIDIYNEAEHGKESQK